jgi:hypothetical protein
VANFGVDVRFLALIVKEVVVVISAIVFPESLRAKGLLHISWLQHGLYLPYVFNNAKKRALNIQCVRSEGLVRDLCNAVPQSRKILKERANSLFP